MCGSTDAQNNILEGQQSFFDTMKAEAGTVFQENSALYNQLLGAFKPILEAGPGQEGFSAPEKAAFDTQATEKTAGDYAQAARAVGERDAGAGGGNEYIPSGQTAADRGRVAIAGAQEEASQEERITEEDYAQGNSNYKAAVSGLLGAGEAFAPSENLFSETTSAGSAAEKSANDVAQSDNAWMGAVGGLLGEAAGGWASGGFKLPQ